MRIFISIVLCIASFVAQAQSWQDELTFAFRGLNAQTNETAFVAGIEKLDSLNKKHNQVWQAAYYAAWYRILFLQRPDFKTQLLRETYLFQAEELLKPWLKQKPNEELYILNAYIDVLRMKWFKEFGSSKFTTNIEKNIEAARLLSSEHPRLKLVEGLYFYYGEEGDENQRADRCRDLLIQAEEGFKIGFQNSYPLMPSWGWDICMEQLKLLR